METEKEAVVTTNCEKSAEAIVPKWIYTFWEGQNFRRWSVPCKYGTRVNESNRRQKQGQTIPKGELPSNGTCGKRRV